MPDPYGAGGAGVDDKMLSKRTHTAALMIFFGGRLVR